LNHSRGVKWIRRLSRPFPMHKGGSRIRIESNLKGPISRDRVPISRVQQSLLPPRRRDRSQVKKFNRPFPMHKGGSRTRIGSSLREAINRVLNKGE
jgi:hypothetical protein